MSKLKLYTYYDSENKNKNFVTVSATGILEADDIIVSRGYNIRKMVVAIGLKIIFIDTAIIRRYVEKPAKGVTTAKFGYTSGVVFESRSLDNKEEGMQFYKDHKFKICKPYTDVYFKINNYLERIK